MTTLETYVPLYRKYRPQSFADLVGQDVVSTALSTAINLNKIAHAYLLCGPRGTGKTSSARILAKSLNCQEGPTPTPCQVCPSCLSVTEGNALDVTEIDAASNNGVNEIRNITEKVQFSAMLGKYRIFIIDEVHMLTTQAFNALLKTLEEPPPNVIFIFATTEPHKVLPTIVSRCQRFDFSRITRQHLEERLLWVAQQEQISINAEAISLIARHAKGGMRDALSLLDQVSVLGKGVDGSQQITPEVVQQFMGGMTDQDLLQLTDTLIQQAPDQLLIQLNELQEKGLEPVQIVKNLMNHFKQLVIAKACGPEVMQVQLDISPDWIPQLAEQAKAFEVEELPQIVSRLSAMEYQLRQVSDTALWLEVGLLELCYRSNIASLKQLQERLTALEDQLKSGVRPSASAPTQASRPAPKPSTYASPPVTQAQPQARPQVAPVAAAAASNDLATVWQTILKAIKHAPTMALLKDNCRLDLWEAPQMKLVFTSDINYSLFKRSPDKVQHLQVAITEVLGPGVNLRLEVDKALKAATKVAVAQPVTEAPAGPPVQESPLPPVNAATEPDVAEPVAAVPVISGPPTPDEMPPDIDAPPVEDSEPQPIPTPVSVVEPSTPVADSETSAESTPPAVEQTPEAEALAESKQFVKDLLQGKPIDTV